MHDEVKAFLLGFGFSETEIEKILAKRNPRDVDLIKAKINGYKDVLRLNDDEVRRIVLAFPALLGFDLAGENETSVEEKINAYKDIFKLSDKEIRKMVITFPLLLGFDVISESENSVKGKIKVYKNLFKLSDEEIIKMIVANPLLLSSDTADEGESSVKGKIKIYKELLKLNDDEIREMIINSPQLLSFDVSSDRSSSVKAKIAKIQQIIPFDTLREIAIKKPMLLLAPAQSFKIRFMIASLSDSVSLFFSNGFITSEKKVWARLCYLQSIKSTFGCYLYRSEKRFNKVLGVSSEELMERFPLDEKAVKEIERAYFEKTGERMTLDESELTYLGLEG